MFNIRKKPKKPTKEEQETAKSLTVYLNENEKERHNNFQKIANRLNRSLYSLLTLKELKNIIKEAEEYVKDFKEGTMLIQVEEYNHFRLFGIEKISNEDWSKRKNRYREDLKKYNKWKRENKENIEKELERRKKNKIQQLLKKQEKLKEKNIEVQKEIEKIKK